MAYFPFMIEICDKSCLVVGGGTVALNKVKKLLGFGVHIKVVSRHICEELCVLEREQEKKRSDGAENSQGISEIELIKREYQDCDVEGMDFVIAATDDEDLNRHISELCRQRSILVNVVDVKDACSFIFPAMIQKQDLLIAVSSGGQSPAATAYVKEKIAHNIPDYYGDMVETLGNCRNYILENVDDSQKRKEIFHKLLEYGDLHGGDIPEEIVRKAVQEVCE